MVAQPKMFSIYFPVFTNQTHITSCNSFQMDPLISPHLSPLQKYWKGFPKESHQYFSFQNVFRGSMSYSLFNLTFKALGNHVLIFLSSLVLPYSPRGILLSVTSNYCLLYIYPVLPCLAIFVQVISSAWNSLQTQSSCQKF